MKVSVDGILGSARKINSQRDVKEEKQSKGQGVAKKDSLAINTRINSRVDNIEQEFRQIQSSITKNQVIRDGISQLRDDLEKGGSRQEDILKQVTYGDKPVLADFLGEERADAGLEKAFENVNNLIHEDVTSLKKLQVELDNITASNLAETDRPENLMSFIDKMFNEADKPLDQISSINADTVMRLLH